MIVYADSSAMVTRYAPGEHDVLPSDAIVAASAIARVEVVSALWRQARDNVAPIEEIAALVREFEADWLGLVNEPRRYQSIAASHKVLARAASIAGTHGLRSLDAIQLASALTARDAEPELRTIVVLDERLRRAAATEHFDLLPT